MLNIFKTKEEEVSKEEVKVDRFSNDVADVKGQKKAEARLKKNKKASKAVKKK